MTQPAADADQPAGHSRHAAPGPPGVLPARSRSTLPWLLALVGTLALLCCGGGAAAGVLLDEAPARPAADGPAEPAGPPAGPTPSTRAPNGSVDPEGVPPPEPTGTAPDLPADTTYTGRGDETVQLSLSAGVRHVATVSHRGDANFVVWGLDRAGSENGLVVNAIGGYDGTRPLDFGTVPAALRVEADGAWTITVRAFDRLPAWDGTSSSGTGPTVLRLDPGRGVPPDRASVSHTGEANVVVVGYVQQSPTLLLQTLLVNEIGRYAGEVSLPPGTVAVEVDAVGPWTVRGG